MQVKNLKRELTEKAAGLAGASLRIAGSYGPSLSLIPQAIAIFTGLHPAVPISLQTASSYVIEELLLNSEIEIGFIA
ncbi:MAG: LysR substrate-binding domain-containing protein, partial [Candidatus Binatia bacterium]|nr:LysR substrate-binding domain-containing protein [Candidatus Binatia bacterium]